MLQNDLRGGKRPAVKVCSPYPRLFFLSMMNFDQSAFTVVQRITNFDSVNYCTSKAISMRNTK